MTIRILALLWAFAYSAFASNPQEGSGAPSRTDWYNHKKHWMNPGVLDPKLDFEIRLDCKKFLAVSPEDTKIKPAVRYLNFLSSKIEDLLKINHRKVEQDFALSRMSQMIFAIRMYACGFDGFGGYANAEESRLMKKSLVFAALGSPDPSRVKEQLFSKAYPLGSGVDSPVYQNEEAQNRFSLIKTQLDGIGHLWSGLKAGTPISDIKKQYLDVDSTYSRYCNQEIERSKDKKQGQIGKSVNDYLKLFDFEEYANLIRPHLNLKQVNYEDAFKYAIHQGFIQEPNRDPRVSGLYYENGASVPLKLETLPFKGFGFIYEGKWNFKAWFVDEEEKQDNFDLTNQKKFPSQVLWNNTGDEDFNFTFVHNGDVSYIEGRVEKNTIRIRKAQLSHLLFVHGLNPNFRNFYVIDISRSVNSL